MALAEDLLIIHRVITRALAVAEDRGRHFATAGFGSPGDEKGYRDFSRCLVKLIKGHHDSEEVIIFPRLRPVLPLVPYADLESQHHELVGALDAAGAALDAADAGAAAATWLDRLVSALGRARETWTAHIAVEEGHFTQAALDAVLDAAKQGDISKAAAEDGQKRGHIPQLNIAFVLYNLQPAERALFSAKFPPQLVELVHGPWKEQWSTMKPFLLE
jgi:hypothetical protein